MPEDTSTDVKCALDNLENYSLHNSLARTRDYDLIHDALQREEHIGLNDVQRLLAICSHDLKEDMKYTTITMQIISLILSRAQVGVYEPCPDLVPSALAVIHILKTTALINKVETLRNMCFGTLLSFPNKTLIAVAKNHANEVTEIFNVYCHVKIPSKSNLQVCRLLYTLLIILSSKSKQVFIGKAIKIWFSRIFPTVISHISVDGDESDMCMEILELLTEDLVAFDYTDCPQWISILESICDPKKYPALMKNLLLRGSSLWHRLWIVFIKLLKYQVTQLLGTGTPINSMLPVVEAAFKLDVDKRCKAFECWNILIDSFATETNESNINKRIKLLIIPLKSNNAKTEGTALAKFKCWWHLIIKFHRKMDNCLDSIIVPFLHFCFGKYNADKSVLVPGQISTAVRKQCIQGLVNLLGHANCSGCTDLPTLPNKIINTFTMVNYWDHWVFSLTSAIMISASNSDGLTSQQMKCLWKSFLITLGELPENNVRKDLYHEMLSLLLQVVEKTKSDDQFVELVFNNLVLSLFDEDKRIKQLLRTKNDIRHLFDIFSIILHPSLSFALQSSKIDELVTKLTPVADTILNPVVCSPNTVIDFILKTNPASNNSLLLWIALAESILLSKLDLCSQTLCNVMLWPFKTISVSRHMILIKIASMKWYTTYDLLYPKLEKTDVHKEIFVFLWKDNNTSTTYFTLCVTLAVLKHKLTDINSSECEKAIELLQTLTSKIDNYCNYEQLFPILIDRVLTVTNTVMLDVNETLTRRMLMCIKSLVTVLTPECIQQSDVTHRMSLVQNLLKQIELIFKIESFTKLIPIIVDNLIEFSSVLIKQSLTKNTFISIIKICKSKIVETDTTFVKLKDIIDETENDIKESSDTNKFTTPKTNEVPKRTKKKEASIVNTVVENGEEYVVVKSNWKFNPRKLTENQKEKFQRKRENIPALYQDLSQSQDEFKLIAWKTDSQDTSNSSKSESKPSKSGSNETATEILKNMPSSNVVPRILEGFFSENEKRDSSIGAKDASSNVKNVEPTTTKTTKSPRMALKDRVFRNVRNLIEKSGVQKENKDGSEDLNKTESIIRTPIQSKNNDRANIINSAPSLLSADRPSRVKRKPKKFDELQLLNPKKRRPDAKSVQNDSAKTSFETESANTSCKDKAPENLNTVDEIMQTDEGNVKIVPEINYKEKSIEVTDKDKRLVRLELSTDNNSEKSDSKKVINEKDAKCQNVNGKEDNYKEDEESILLINQKCPSPVNTTTDIIETLTLLPAGNSKRHASENLNAKKNVHKDGMSIDKMKKNKNGNETNICTVSYINKVNEVSTPIQESKNVENNEEKSTAENNFQTDGKCDDKQNNSSPIKTIHLEEKMSSSIIISKDKETEEQNSGTEENFQKHDNSNNKKDEMSNDKLKCTSSVKTTNKAQEVSTPLQSSKNKETYEQKSTTKKNSGKKSRIEKELAIDMVEGHPFLKMSSQKRLTRKALESAGTSRRKSSVERLNKSKSDANSSVKCDRKAKEKCIENESPSTTIIVDDSQEKDTNKTAFSEEIPYSDDVIESSQDSTMTTISVKSAKKTTKKVPVVSLQKIRLNTNNDIHESQSILDCVVLTNPSPKANQDSKDDIELPLNKTAVEEKSQADLTENMDTEPIDGQQLSDVVIILNDDINRPLTISSDEPEVGPESQEIAEADTQPTDPKDLMDIDVMHEESSKPLNMAETIIKETVICTIGDKPVSIVKQNAIHDKIVNPTDTTLTMSDSACADLEKESGASSPSSFRDEALRKQDFLNNTIEISPIKNMSPERTKKSPSPETSSDYVVIKLSSPVQSNGEPFEKCGSPEVFTEDKVSPDKRDHSPPRTEVTVVITSPSSSLSLKKNRPQVRSGGRAAQMLGLCVPDKQSIINADKVEVEEVKKCVNTSSTPARRNLRILYNSVSENTDTVIENEDIDNFLKFRRSLPAVDSSPSVPILKRKLVEIADDGMISPASKRKRVSFHDPPVSTTISVQKYIEPGVLRSPQNSAHKRQERQLRQHTPMKSPKRLDHAFKLDTVLTKTIESFTETEAISTLDTQTFSLDETPVVEIVRPTELNDTDPICPDLLDCKDPIDEIAGELSSSAMKSLLVKELVGKVETVGDLAKMTELEVNRLCIKAPKVKVAKKVLTDYASKKNDKPDEPPCEITVTVDAAVFDEPMTERVIKVVDMEVQTVGSECNEMEVQTIATLALDTFVQTETIPITHTSVQTDESGSKSTSDIFKLCLAERPDFVEQIGEHLEESSIQQITDKLPFSAITDVLMKKVTSTNSTTILNRILEHQCDSTDDNRSNKQLSFIRDYVCDKYDSKDLILFCSEVLKSVYDKGV